MHELSFTYPGAESPTLEKLSFSVAPGEFITLCGGTGSGKSTLLRCLKPSLTPGGRLVGERFFKDVPLEALDGREEACSVGFVMQNAEEQIVTDSVWHELAFGAESIGMPRELMRSRVAETAAYFGQSELFHAKTDTLSGGQKQLLCLASTMLLSPELLLLDEPTARLDPIAAERFFDMVKRINRELGTTVILCEHKLDAAFEISDRVLFLENGRLASDGDVRTVSEFIYRSSRVSAGELPCASRVALGSVGQSLSADKLPISIREGRKFLLDRLSTDAPSSKPTAHPLTFVHGCEKSAFETRVRTRALHFGYDAKRAEVLAGLDIEAYAGEFLAVLGGNGVGKSTLLSLLAGSLEPTAGKIELCGKLACLPQDPLLLFSRDSVAKELFAQAEACGIDPNDGRVAETVALCGIAELLKRHPYDLSGGEREMAALAKLLICMPDILLLDEPTKGLDAAYSLRLSNIIRQLKKCGTAVIAVTHDAEFSAANADRCAMLFDGSATFVGTPREFFAANRFYTTPACRMAQGIIDGAVCTEDIIAAISDRTDESDGGFKIKSGGTDDMPDVRDIKAADVALKASFSGDTAVSKVKKTPREVGVGAMMLLLLALSFIPTVSAQLSPLFALPLRIALILSAALRLIPSSQSVKILPVIFDDRKTPKRNFDKLNDVMLFALMLIFSIMTVAAGVFVFDDRHYYLISFILLAGLFLPFALVYEKKRPRSKELALTGSLAALGVAGRAVFYMLPQVKPLAAVVIISGISLGPQCGFLVGALAAFVSNFMFGQGPYTPWQMAGFGIIGALAGIIFGRNGKAHGRLSICVYGALSVLVIYGVIMNTATMFVSGSEISYESVMAFLASGLPFDLVHALSSAVFLFVLALPMLAKLERIKKRAGMSI